MDEAWKLVLWLLLTAIGGVIGTKASVAFDRGIRHVSEILRARRDREQQRAWGDAALLAAESQALLIWLGQILLAVLALLSLSLSALCLGLLALFANWIQQLPIAFAGIGLLLTALAAVRGTTKLELVLVQPTIQALIEVTSEALANGRGEASHPSGITASVYRQEAVSEER